MKLLSTEAGKSSKKLRKCQYDSCSKEFSYKTHNQKYCSDECCRLATNKRIMERYYAKKKRRNGERRRCLSCDTFLSRYNDLDYCSVHESDHVADFELELL